MLKFFRNRKQMSAQALKNIAIFSLQSIPSMTANNKLNTIGKNLEIWAIFLSFTQKVANSIDVYNIDCIVQYKNNIIYHQLSVLLCAILSKTNIIFSIKMLLSTLESENKKTFLQRPNSPKY